MTDMSWFGEDLNEFKRKLPKTSRFLPRYPRNRAPHCSWALQCCSPHMPRPKPWQLQSFVSAEFFLWTYQRCTGSQEMFPTLPSGRNSNVIKFLDIRNSELQNNTKHKAFRLKLLKSAMEPCVIWVQDPWKCTLMVLFCGEKFVDRRISNLIWAYWLLRKGSLS